MPSAPYTQYLPDWRQRLRRLMDAKGLSDRKLAMRANLGYSTVNEWFRPSKNKTPSFPSISAVMQVLEAPIDYLTNPDAPDHLPVQKPGSGAFGLIDEANISYATLLGSLQLGAWQDQSVNTLGDSALVPCVPHPDFEGIKQYAWRLLDDSMASVIKPGGYIIGVAFRDIVSFRPLMPRDLVICSRRDGDRVERTMRRAIRTAAGFELVSESSDAALTTSWPLATPQHDENGTIAATHLVIGAFRFLA